ncbi:hypothetical protein X777_04219 [Ooceraea biroi]|uniref:Uncharacterized protein n=1 Tax=Ooceraea biroi TaxID=2015173 RepID=A0A026WJ61_OOCBI|nr:hypothetical protein X777_04219 [Ooceraea biroi]
MIVATHKCGCPVPSSIAEPVELGAPCSPCCPRPLSTQYPKVQPAVSTRESQKIISERRPRGNGESKSRGIRVSNAKKTGSDRIVSEIVRKRQPYKEIEAVINDNRVIVRMHKEPMRQEYDPPCECIEKICEETGCRTVTLYPQADAKDGDDPAARNDRSREKRPLDLEKNPNIFVLRIRKYGDNSDKKQKIDLEFRAPRPWLPREDKKLRKDLEKPEELEKHGKLEAHEGLEEHEMLEKYELRYL